MLLRDVTDPLCFTTLTQETYGNIEDLHQGYPPYELSTDRSHPRGNIEKLLEIGFDVNLLYSTTYTTSFDPFDPILTLFIVVFQGE